MQMVLRALTSLVVLVASLVFVGFVGSSPASAGPSYANRVESSVITATNRTRVRRDRRAVRGNACLDRVAESWARHLAATNTFRHRQLGRVLGWCDRAYVSENLAKVPASPGTTAARVARRAVRAWMRSPGHRRNLLSRKPHVIGVGVTKSANGRYWLIVQNFAR